MDPKQVSENFGKVLNNFWASAKEKTNKLSSSPQDGSPSSLVNTAIQQQQQQANLKQIPSDSYAKFLEAERRKLKSTMTGGGSKNAKVAENNNNTHDCVDQNQLASERGSASGAPSDKPTDDKPGVDAACNLISACSLTPGMDDDEFRR